MSLDNKVVLVTGGTGTIGGQVVRDLLQKGSKIVIFSRDQNKQYTMNHSISSSRIVYRNGDICDFNLLMRAMKGVDYVVHCAASKHIQLCEENPDSAMKINVEGTRNVLTASLQRGVQKFILLSTDKAVYPISVMGATKFLAEKLTLEFSRHFPASIVRLGNVFGSNGSVVPTFLDRIKNKLPLIVIPSLRYFISRKDAGEFIVDRLDDMVGGEIFIKKMKQIKIDELAECIAPVGYPIKKADLLECEKFAENLFMNQEKFRVHDCLTYWKISGEKKEKPFEFNPDDFSGIYSKEEINQMLKGN